jgi:flagellar hook-associated protein 2
VSSVALSGTGVDNLFGTAVVTAGVDVAGTIGGFTGTGSGQTLAGATGTAVEGLQVLVNGGATGARGDIVYTQGYAAKLNQALASLVGSDGVVSTSTNAANKRIQDIADRREVLQLRLQKLESNYLAQFRALDAMLSKMNATSTYLTQQLDALSSLTKQINK